MKYLLTGVRALIIILNTGFQITLLSIDSLINGKSQARSFKHRRRWAKRCISILGIKIDEVQGKIDIPTALIVSNHRSLIDPVIQLAYFDTFIIAKAEVSKLPVISQGAQMTGIIFVKREKLRSRLAARNQTEEILLNGGHVLVYPEGTTGTNQTTDPFKRGTFAVAASHKIPVIPVALEYPDEKDYWYEHSLSKQMVRQIGVWRTRVKMRIGEPIISNNAVELKNSAQESINKNLLEMQVGWSEIFIEDNEHNAQKEGSA